MEVRRWKCVDGEGLSEATKARTSAHRRHPRPAAHYSLTPLSRIRIPAAHVCSAIDYKDNDKLLEEHVNHMAGNTLRTDGVCIKLVTRVGEAQPGVFIEDRNQALLHTYSLDANFESHFEARCQECEA